MASVLAMFIPTHAAQAGVIFDPIAQEFYDATIGWFANSYALGTQIFLSIAGIRLIYDIVTYAIDAESFVGVGAVLIRSLTRLAIPYAILQGATKYLNDLIGVAGQLLGKITADSVTAPAALPSGNAVSPDSLAWLGVQIGWQLPTTAFKLMQQMGFQPMNMTNFAQTFSSNAHQAIVDLILCLATMLSGFAIVLMFWYIAAELLVAYIEVSFIAPLGLWSLGFMASSATAPIAESYIGTILRMITRFMAILAMSSIVQRIAQGWLKMMSNLSSFNPTHKYLAGVWPQDNDLLTAAWSMVGGTLVLIYIVRRVSRISGNILNGSPSLTGRGLLSQARNPLQ